jgi:photosystem II stability/assembly factor-like uncharacterized protein
VIVKPSFMQRLVPTALTILTLGVLLAAAPLDGGALWQRLGPGLREPVVLAIAVDPSDAGHIIVSAGSQLYRSRDDGESWAILPPPSQKRITHLLIDGENSETIYAVAQP